MAGTSGSVAGRPDLEYEILCDSAGAFLRRYVLDDTGTLGHIDTTLDGTPYAAVGTVQRCSAPTAPLIDSTLQRQTGAGNVTIPAGARSVTLVVYGGSPTVAIGAGAAVAVVAGTSLTWGVDTGGKSGESLQDAFVFTGVAGSDFLVSSTREI
ncbi:hypothetical protein VSR01_16225 [Actinacidiphila sp. DG2A-62]|uniref:hypothetical protein n=1 Tax=Actinacidiphila sp. DG2A-62 TaxID=3108821 RepID=UPI002DBFF7C1|nr:hypothetical protein [Actinacidiphila sp. DG2A-62]MEC3994992.1 hypothetical protein [Actinacidiphila sp. DG2A-62]